MTAIRVRFSDGVNTDNGSTWALAKLDLAGFDAAPDAAGDTAYLSHTHSESTAGVLTIALAGTAGNPSRILCVNDSLEDPTTLADTAVVATSGAFKIRVTGSAYIYGVKFRAGGAGSNFANLELNPTGLHHQVYHRCELVLANSHPSSLLLMGGSASGDSTRTDIVDCGISLASASQCFNLGGEVNIKGGSLLAGSTSTTVTATTGLFTTNVTGKDAGLTVSDFDFSNLNTSFSLFAAPSGATHKVGTYLITNSKLPTGWTGALVSGAVTSPGWRAEMYNMIVGSSKLYAWIEDSYGTLRDTQTVYRTGGFAIRAVPVAMRLTTSANASYPSGAFRSNPIERAYPGTAAEEAAFVAGATKTVSVEFIHDTSVAAGQGAGASFAFQNNEFAMEVRVLNTAGSVISTTVTTLPADVLAAPADLPSSSEAWTSTGMTTPVKQKFSVNIAPQEKGTLVARIVGYKAGKSITYCQKMTVA